MIRNVTVAILLVAIGAQPACADTPAQRVVSLDFCADQFVLKLLPRSSILALSPDADKEFSYMRSAASGIPSVRPVAEDILMIEPGMVVRSYGGGPRVQHFFARAGLPVVQVPYTGNIAGVRDSIRDVAMQLGVAQRGEDIVAEMDARLSRLGESSFRKSALYVTPTGVTSGPGTLVHDMLLAAGLRNFQSEPGWHSMPLERLAYEQPDVVAAAFFNASTTQPAMWSAMRHPVARRQIKNQPMVSIDGSWTACGGWFLLDAIEALATLQAGDESP